MLTRRLQRTVKLPLHKIANVCIGQFDARSQVRLFFPQVVSYDGPPRLSQEDCALIYDKGIYPAVKSVVEGDISHWPLSYSVAQTQCRDVSGHWHFGTIDLPQYCLTEFAAAVRQQLGLEGHLGTPFFGIELRGTKGRYQFLLDDEQSRRDAFNAMTANLCLNRDDLDGWYVDVGLEVIRPHHVVQWTSASHALLLAHALPSCNEEEVIALERGSNFERDLSGHLFDLAGFRCHPGARGRADGVCHINVYTTDKTVTYQPGHKGVFGPHCPKDLYPGAIRRLLDNVNAMAGVFEECAGRDGHTQDGTARFEIRVGVSRCMEALQTFPQELLERSTVCIDNRSWW